MKSVKRNRYVVLVSFLLLDIGILLFADISFATKDDVRLLSLLSGTMLCREPTEYVMYPNILFGLTLKELYTRFPHLPWYFLVLAFNLVVSHLSILEVVLRRATLPAAIFIGIAFMLFFLEPTFTTVAILMAAAGFVLLYDLLEAENWRENILRLFLLFYLLLAGAVVRIHGYAFAFLFGTLFILLTATKNLFWRKAAPLLGVLFFLVSATVVYNHRYYTEHRENSGFYEYNRYKAFLNDFNLAEYSENIDEALSQAEWSRNDYELFHGWMFIENETFSLQRLERFVEALHPSFFEKSSEAVKLYADLFSHPYVLVLLFMVAGVFLLSKESGKKRLALLGVFLFILFVFSAVSVVMKTPPPRIYLGVLYLFALMVVLETSLNAENRWAAVLFFVASLMLLAYYKRVDERNLSRQRNFLQNLELVDASFFYLSVDDALEPRGLDPRSDVQPLKRYKVVPFGTVVLLSETKRFMRENGLKDYDDLVRGKGIYLLFPKRGFHKSRLLKRYLQEHFHIETDIEIVRENENMFVVRFTPATRAR